MLTIVALVALPSAAAAQSSLVPESVQPPSPSEPPPGFAVSPDGAQAIAERLPEVREARSQHGRLEATVGVPASAGDGAIYEVAFITPGRRSQYGSDIRVEVVVGGLTGDVLAVWTGPQAATPLARGLEPSIGRSLNRPYVWIPLALLFLLPFFDPRRPLRLVHLDLLVLLAFGVSQLYFNQGWLEISVPLVYPLLGYLVVRMLLAGLRPRPRSEPLVPRMPVPWMAIGLVLLVAFRVALNIGDSTVIDVGYASVVGADRIAHGEELYVLNDVYGDTYGPVTYLSYLPFETLLPWDGTWGAVPAAHAAAIAFDLLTIVGLMVLGTRLRAGQAGRRLGLALAFAWAAYPFSLLVLQENTNDGLVAALVVFALAAVASPVRRGLLLGLASAAKFVPLALAPLLATGTGEHRPRSWARFSLAFAAMAVVSVAAFVPDGGLRELYDTTIGFQLGRGSPFSVWSLHPSLEWLQTALKLSAGALAIAVAFFPRRRSARQVVALAAAVLVAIQLPATNWFYFYLAWVAPLVLAASFSGYSSGRVAAASGRDLDGWSRSAGASG